jgi:hypothetical protein
MRLAQQNAFTVKIRFCELRAKPEEALRWAEEKRKCGTT